ncbi:hypothetical protein FX985_04813 [Pseudomonas extremaustralis]|uniref:Uncharacterized protein n=1 Tax=Pseudomonas extremaustralis TaxID=359110 RepID=A0A5M9ISN8_9PSED|nr:hypothetical protein FX985_04813 [Pseudomonas extremaustralis]
MSTQINGSMALRFLSFNTPSPETADTRPSARGQNGYRPPSSQQPHNANYAWNRPQPARPGNNPNRPQPALPENAGHRPLPARPGNHWQPAQDDWQRPPHNSSNRPQPAHPGNNPHRPQPALPENAGHRPLPARPGNHWQPAQDDWQRPPHNSSNRPPLHGDTAQNQQPHAATQYQSTYSEPTHDGYYV